MSDFRHDLSVPSDNYAMRALILLYEPQNGERALLPASNSTHRLIAALETGGLLLLQDKSFPSVVGVITGESLAGSWWSQSACDPDLRRFVAVARSPYGFADMQPYGGKVTCKGRRFWPWYRRANRSDRGLALRELVEADMELKPSHQQPRRLS